MINEQLAHVNSSPNSPKGGVILLSQDIPDLMLFPSPLNNIHALQLHLIQCGVSSLSLAVCVLSHQLILQDNYKMSDLLLIMLLPQSLTIPYLC